MCLRPTFHSLLTLVALPAHPRKKQWKPRKANGDRWAWWGKTHWPRWLGQWLSSRRNHTFLTWNLHWCEFMRFRVISDNTFYFRYLDPILVSYRYYRIIQDMTYWMETVWFTQSEQMPQSVIQTFYVFLFVQCCTSSLTTVYNLSKSLTSRLVK